MLNDRQNVFSVKESWWIILKFNNVQSFVMNMIRIPVLIFQKDIFVIFLLFVITVQFNDTKLAIKIY